MLNLSKIDGEQSLQSQILKQLPETVGVYFFANAKKEVIYIGKAKNLKSRLASYFNVRGVGIWPKTARMMSEAKSLSFIKVDSEFEALLLEAKLVRQRQPKYNIQLKDDKTPLYIVITKEKYPRVIAARKTQLGEIKIKAIFGPFLESQSVRKILRWVRRIIPFSQHSPFKSVCIYKQLGLCNPCPSEIEAEKDPVKYFNLRKRYLRNISKVKKILAGGVSSLKKDLDHEMKQYAKKEMFEEAEQVARQIKTLEYITTPHTSVDLYLKDPNFLEDIRKRETDELKKLLISFFNIKRLRRIECFDIAHLAGTKPTASMVTFINGEAEKRFYRHFKVKINKKQSDTDSMKSILERRVRHLDDWGRPDLVIVDGGKAQVGVASEVLGDLRIPVIGLAKRYETVVIKKGDKFIEIRPKGAALNLLQRVRDEAHRFARRLHHKQIRDSLIGI